MGITNMLATIPGFLVPAVVGALTHGKVNLVLIFNYNFVPIKNAKNYFSTIRL